MLTDEQIAQRRPVWVALSELFLDTEMDDVTAAYIARTITESGLDSAAAEKILYEEVGPVFGSNLLNVAGEWAGWPDDVIESCITAYLQTAAGSQTLGAAAYRRLIADDWARVTALI